MQTNKRKQTKMDVMEEIYRKDKFCSAGDIAFALSRRFPNAQGHNFELANKFISMKKQEERVIRAQEASKRVAKQENERSFLDEIWNFAHEIVEKVRQEGERWTIKFPREEVAPKHGFKSFAEL